ncbi:unnamed protein product [Anisakis simplex]|uniref:Nuclear hormone receptor family member nhr-97 (inferred by orthology to a C. elegans protein) n=1 Tax=Anisakis simplex TaxID=6269 RepID=A0A0M3IYT8_ANISI|nr:unnamed protein product [Anisakis simplex]
MASDAQPPSKQRVVEKQFLDPVCQLQNATLPMECVVCGDRACSHHYYGVAACHGCKCFFWRSVKGNAKYVCRYDGNCAINVNGRNSCRYCRFNRCLQAGMKPEDANGLSTTAVKVVSMLRDRVHAALYQHCTEHYTNVLATMRFTLAGQLEDHIQLSHTFCKTVPRDDLLYELLGDIFDSNCDTFDNCHTSQRGFIPYVRFG